MAWTITNRGKFYFLNNDMSAADLRLGVIAGASLPAGATSPDLNFVSELLAVSGTTEAAASGYARKDLAGVATSEDDTNDWAVLTWTAPTWTAVATGETWRAVFLYVEAGSDAARTLIGVDDTTDLPTNGSDVTYSGASIRLT